MDEEKSNLEKEINEAHIFTAVEMRAIVASENSRGYYRGHHDGIMQAFRGLAYGLLVGCAIYAILTRVGIDESK